jgi:hypothetical protein
MRKQLEVAANKIFFALLESTDFFLRLQVGGVIFKYAHDLISNFSLICALFVELCSRVLCY